MSKLVHKLKKSWFFTNNVYLFVIMVILAGVNLTLSAVSFIFILILYLYFLFTAKLPIEPKETFNCITHVYRTKGKTSLKLDVWYPNKKKEAYPLVFFAHGGGWVSGFRNQPNNVSWCRFLASKGFASASIDYSYGFLNTLEEIISDYSAALDYLRANASDMKLDKKNIILMGLSAGGHLALLYSSYFTYTSNLKRMEGIRGVVSYYSPSDLRDIFSEEDKSLFARFAASATLKGTPSSSSEVYAYYSPIEWISERMIPAVIVHGRNDTIVPYYSSMKLFKKMKSLNLKCRFLIHNEGGHCFDTKRMDFRTTRILLETVKIMRGLIKNED